MKPEKAIKTENRRMKRARLIRDGMSWRQACLQSGYSLATANRGPKNYVTNEAPGVAKDFELAAEEAIWKPETLRKIVTHRLATSVIEGKPSNVAREAELLGKQKDVDMFVRPESQGDTNIFALLAQPEVGKMLDEACKALDSGKYFNCDWCYSSYNSLNELAEHTLTCPKNPTLKQKPTIDAVATVIPVEGDK